MQPGGCVRCFAPATEILGHPAAPHHEWNFPAAECANKTTSGEKVELSCDLPTALDDEPAKHMSPSPGVALPPAGREVTDALKATIVKHCPGVSVTPCERFAFYLRRGALSLRTRSCSAWSAAPTETSYLPRASSGPTERTSSRKRLRGRPRPKRKK